MSIAQEYAKALADMGASPLEFGEAQPPKRRRAAGGGRKPLPAGDRKVERDLMIEPHILAAVDANASEHDKSRSASVNELLQVALQMETGQAPGKE